MAAIFLLKIDIIRCIIAETRKKHPMAHTYTALIQQRGEWWIGWIQEIPSVNCQERTRDELLDTLKITLSEILEINREEAINLVENGYQAVAIQI